MRRCIASQCGHPSKEHCSGSVAPQLCVTQNMPSSTISHEMVMIGSVAIVFSFVAVGSGESAGRDSRRSLDEFEDAVSAVHWLARGLGLRNFVAIGDSVQHFGVASVFVSRDTRASNLCLTVAHLPLDQGACADDHASDDRDPKCDRIDMLPALQDGDSASRTSGSATHAAQSFLLSQTIRAHPALLSIFLAAFVSAFAA
jgi:hypothetical protein